MEKAIEFKAGDRFTAVFTKVKGRGRISMSARECTFVELHPLDSSYAKVKLDSGKIVNVAASRLTPAGERNALTKALCGED